MTGAQRRASLAGAAGVALGGVPLAGMLLVAGVFAGTPGCSDGSHLFSGQIYDDQRGCLGSPMAIDVVEGDDPGSCEAKCLVGPSIFGATSDSASDGASSVGAPMTYVSTVCAPYPLQDDSSGSSSACKAALAAYVRHDICQGDGGSSAPIDGGRPLDAAGQDASIDAGADALPSDANAADSAIDAAPQDAGNDSM